MTYVKKSKILTFFFVEDSEDSDSGSSSGSSDSDETQTSSDNDEPNTVDNKQNEIVDKSLGLDLSDDDSDSSGWEISVTFQPFFCLKTRNPADGKKTFCC